MTELLDILHKFVSFCIFVILSGCFIALFFATLQMAIHDKRGEDFPAYALIGYALAMGLIIAFFKLLHFSF